MFASIMQIMPVTVIVGEQRGDEGKGGYTDLLAEEHDFIARANGGPNAGHTIELPDGRVFTTHGLPSGITDPTKMNVLGDGVLIDAPKLVAEINEANEKGFSVSSANLMISSAAHLILPHHVEADRMREAGAGRQGSTQSGISYAAATKYLREGVTIELINNEPEQIYRAILRGLKQQAAKRRQLGMEPIDAKEVAEHYVETTRVLGDYSTDTGLYLRSQLKKRNPARILVEMAQGFLLDIDQGMHPDVTSSTTTSAGAAMGLGLPPTAITRVIGVVKATPSHVGNGPFITEVTDPNIVKALRGKREDVDGEFGGTTGRPRRMGHLDLVQVRRAQQVNGTTEMILSKTDCVPRYGRQVLICEAYSRKGKLINEAPNSARKLSQCIPLYSLLANWQEDISGVRDFKDLPLEAKRYINHIEVKLGVPISIVGVGPGRNQYIKR